MQASERVVEVAGGAFEGSLNLYGTGGNCLVATIQVDTWVYVVGQDDFSIARYTLDEWQGSSDTDPEPQIIEADDAEQTWELLRLVREDCLVWQCGSCDGWIYTTSRPRIGVLACGNGGVDFRHADRAVGGDHA